MAVIPGTAVAATIVPTDSADTHATHDQQYGKGGWREVATIAERDAISVPRRREGMVVYVVANSVEYVLGTDLATWTARSTGGGGETNHTLLTNLGLEVAGHDVTNVNEELAPSAGQKLLGFEADLVTPLVVDVDKIGGGGGVTDHALLDAASLDIANSGHTYTAPGTGAISRDLKTVLDEQVISVKAFGAKGDGTIDADDPNGAAGTDDTFAIAQAIAYAHSIGGGTVYFPPGIYLISATLRVTDNRITLSGGNSTVNFELLFYNHAQDSFLNLATLVWVGPDSVVDPLTREVDLDSHMLLIEPDFESGTYPLYADQLTDRTQAIQNHNFQEWATGTTKFVPVYGYIDDESDILHHGNVYECIKPGGITRGENTLYYPPWNHPTEWSDVTTTVGKPPALWATAISGFKIENMCLLAGSGPTGAWENRMCVKNAARCIKISQATHYTFHNVYMGFATDVAMQVGGIIRTQTLGWTTRFTDFSGLYVNQLNCIGVGIRIGEYLSNAELALGMETDGQWKTECKDIEVWWGFSESKFMDHWVYTESASYIQMLANEHSAGRILNDNDPLCGFQLCGGDHNEWRNVNINSQYGSWPSVWITGTQDPGEKSAFTGYCDCNTFNKLSASVLMCGVGRSYPTRDVSDIRTFIANPLSKHQGLRLVDFNVGNGGGAGPDEDPDSFNVELDTTAYASHTGVRMAGSVYMHNSSIFGAEQLVGGRWSGSIDTANLYKQNRDILFGTFSDMGDIPILMTGSIGLAFTINDLTDGSLNGTYTIAEYGWHRNGAITINEKWPIYTAVHDGHSWTLGTAHSVEITIHPTMNFSYWNHGVMQLEPWMSPANPLTFTGDSDTHYSTHGLDAYYATLVIKQNASGDGVWPGLDPATEAKISWLGGTPLPDLTVLPKNGGVVVTIRRSSVGNKYYCSWEFIGGFIGETNQTSVSVAPVLNQTQATTTFFYGISYVPKKTDGYDSATFTGFQASPQIKTGGNNPGIPFTVGNFQGFLSTPAIDNPDATVTTAIAGKINTTEILQGSCVTSKGLRIKQGTGSPTNLVGLEIAAITRGTVSNYALTTNVGTVQLGDTLELLADMTFGGGGYGFDINGDGDVRDLVLRNLVVTGTTTGIETDFNLNQSILGSGTYVTSGTGNHYIAGGASVNITLQTNPPPGTIHYFSHQLKITGPIYNQQGVLVSSLVLANNQDIALTYVPVASGWYIASMGKHRVQDHTDQISTGVEVDAAVAKSSIIGDTLVGSLVANFVEATGTASTKYKIPWSAESIASNSITLDTVTNIGRFTVDSTGLYTITSEVEIRDDSGIGADWRFYLVKDPGEVPVLVKYSVTPGTPAVVNQFLTITFSYTGVLTSGETYETQIERSTTGAFRAKASENPQLVITRLG